MVKMLDQSSVVKGMATCRNSLPETNSSKIRVVLADDHRMVREGLRGIIEEQTDMTVVAEASDGCMAVDVAHAIRPDVIVMDVNMPRMNGVDATRKIKEELPHVRVIGLSLHNDHIIAGAMRKAGAEAYLSKGSFRDLCSVIRDGKVQEQPEMRNTRPPSS
jgi:DNA-binding NarL/FixJ family response regulator